MIEEGGRNCGDAHGCSNVRGPFSGKKRGDSWDVHCFRMQMRLPQLSFSSSMSDTNLSNLLRPLRNPPEWPASYESVILEPFVYIASKPGKEIRSLLIEAFNVWLDVPRAQLSVISHVVRMLHSASLMVDDIEDGAQLRRGQPVAHRIYGVPQTINTANYVYFLAYKELAALRGHDPGDSDRIVPNKDLDLVVTEELLSLHRGQGLEIFWRDTLQCPTEEEYIAMVNNS